MAVYFLSDIKVTNPSLYDEYRKLVAPTLEQYGGKFLVRGGACESIEGAWKPERLVIVEFEDAAQFHRWYDSPEYTEARNIRFQASTADGILIQGV